MTSNPLQELAEDMLDEMKGVLVEVINGSRPLTENEFFVFVRTYQKAKPHLSSGFQIAWCADLLTMCNMDEVRGGGNALETLHSLVASMMT